MTDADFEIPDFVLDDAVYIALRTFFENIHDTDLFDPLPVKFVRRPLDPEKSRMYAWRHEYEIDERAIRYSPGFREGITGYDEVTGALRDCEFYEAETGNERAQIRETFRVFFYELIRKSEVVGEFDENAFNKVFEEFQRYHTSESIPMKCWTFLGGFDMLSEAVSVDDRFCIRRMNDEERVFLHENFGERSDRKFALMEDFWRNWVAVHRFHADNKLDMMEYARDELERFLTAVRVYGEDGSFRHGHVFIRPEWDYVERQRGLQIQHRLIPSHGPTLRLTPGDTKRFPEFYNEVEGLIRTVSENRFTTALNRLNDAHSKNDPKDKILSCAIGFESILFSGVRNASYSFRIQLRPAILLQNEVFESVEEIRAFFENLYFTRGEIVHGDRDVEDIMQDDSFTCRSDEFDSEEFANQAQYFLARLLRVYLLAQVRHGLSPDALNDVLDDAAFTAELDVLSG